MNYGLPKKPTVNELGKDLLKLSTSDLLLTILQPILFFFLYFIFARLDLWIPAVLSTVALSFTTYGSTSHDLVHKNLQINPVLNEILLTLIELIALRSGHAYRLSHIHHHKRFPHDDDVEGAAAKLSFIRCLLEGVVFQFRLYFWALKNPRTKKGLALIVFEGAMVLTIAGASVYAYRYTPVFLVYSCLMIAGSWIIPLITSYLVHDPAGQNELEQTRLFRGRFFSILAFEHLYHLEHHMYPMVPHKNWPELARRLDPYFSRHHIKPIVFNILADSEPKSDN